DLTRAHRRREACAVTTSLPYGFRPALEATAPPWTALALLGLLLLAGLLYRHWQQRRAAETPSLPPVVDPWQDLAEAAGAPDWYDRLGRHLLRAASQRQPEAT